MIRISNIKIEVNDRPEESLKKYIQSKYHLDDGDIKELVIKKRSIDARKDKVYFVYEIDIVSTKEQKLLKKYKEINISPNEEYVYNHVDWDGLSPVIVGAGPAGLFCAYILSKSGIKPIVVERGEDIDRRVESVNNFWENGVLNPESNVQFGCGGAGTFSDGKLSTLKKDQDNRQKEILKTFYKHGAPESILYDNKPHIGTDYLRIVIKNLCEELESLGTTFMFNTKLTNINIDNNCIKGIEVNNNKWIDTNHLILAIGHSARDTFRMLHKSGIEMENKPFAVGIRVEHPQKIINNNQYKEYAKYLPPASYKLTYHTNDNRGVYSFCMCPGGYVVNSSSELGKLCINGMSNYKRESLNANSAIVVTVNEKDYGKKLFDGLKFQQELEQKTYDYANGAIPTQRYEDFKLNRKTNTFISINPVHKGMTVPANLKEILPSKICNNIEEAMEYFNNLIPGFNDSDSLLSCIEARTSSPIRINRDENFESNIKGIYPCGEGAGYAGGIMTSAMDGMKVAEDIIKKNL